MYQVRNMTPHERSLEAESCYLESRSRTVKKIIEEQVALWLLPVLVVLVIWKILFPSQIPAALGYTGLVLIYATCVLLGSRIRYAQEREVVSLTQSASQQIVQDFHAGQVETIELHVCAAFVLEEVEDEGPTYVLDVGNDRYTVLCEHGKQVDRVEIPGEVVEIVRLPRSKRILMTKWSGLPVKVSGTLKRTLRDLPENCKEGDLVPGQVRAAFPISRA